MLYLQENENCQFKWLTYVKSIFYECGLSEVWNVQQFVNHNFLKVSLKQRVQDQYIPSFMLLLQLDQF